MSLNRVWLLVLLFFCWSLCNGQKTPFSKHKFKEGTWKLEYWIVNHDTVSTETYIINDTAVLKYLWGEFRCNLDKQSDGPNERLIFTYKDNKQIERYIFDDTVSFTFGRLKEYLVKVRFKEFYAPNNYWSNHIIDSLRSNNVDFSYAYDEYFGIDSLVKKYGETGIQLFVNLTFRPWPKDYDPFTYDFSEYVRERFIETYPEIDSSLVTTFRYGGPDQIAIMVNFQKPFYFDIDRIRNVRGFKHIDFFHFTTFRIYSSGESKR